MIGQVHDEPRSGAGIPASEGTDHGTGSHPAGSSDRVGPDARHRTVLVRPEDVDMVIAPEWLADLHDPTLVISHGYVGPDRRSSRRPAPPAAEAPGLGRRLLLVVLMTAVVVVPLTLIAARTVPPAVSTAPVTPAPGPTAPATLGSSGTDRRAARAATAAERNRTRSEDASARAGAASSRALSRAEATSGRALARADVSYARAVAAAIRHDATRVRALSRAEVRAARHARIGSIGSVRGHRAVQGAPAVRSGSAPPVTPAA